MKLFKKLFKKQKKGQYIDTDLVNPEDCDYWDYEGEEVLLSEFDIKDPRSVKPGAILDIAGFRGQGTFIWDGEFAHKTIGDCGYFIPEVGWYFVEKYGVKFFEEASYMVPYLIIESGKTIKIYQADNPSKCTIRRSDECDAICLIPGLDAEEIVEVDGIKYHYQGVY